MASLASFVLHLAQNPDAKAAFESSLAQARAAMDAAGLSPEQQDVLLTGDSAKIAAAVDAELAGKPPEDDLQRALSLEYCPPPPPEA